MTTKVTAAMLAADVPTSASIAQAIASEALERDAAIAAAVAGVQPGGKAANRQVFAASGTWTKPIGFSSNAMVLVEMWGGGGAGGGGLYGAGGGGGGAGSQLGVGGTSFSGQSGGGAVAGGSTTVINSGGASAFENSTSTFGGRDAVGGVAPQGSAGSVNPISAVIRFPFDGFTGGGGSAGAFFKGKSSGKSDAVAAQTADALSKSEEVAAHKEEVKSKVQDSDHAVNSQDRTSLIESLSADSVRKSGKD